MDNNLQTLKAWATRLENEIEDEEARKYFLGLAKNLLSDVERNTVPGVAFMLPLIEQQLSRAQDVVTKYGRKVRIIG